MYFRDLILTLILSFLFLNSAYCAELTNSMSAQYSLGQFGSTGTVSTTNFDLNGAFSFGVSGTALGIKFISPVTQINGTFDNYLYLGLKTGSPTTTQVDLYTGPVGADDPQRPGSTLLCSTTTDISGLTAPVWATFNLTGCSMTAGLTYWLVVSNNSATQASNFPSYRTRGLNLAVTWRFSGFSTTTGFTTDPTLLFSAAEPGWVAKFADGTITGQPYVVSTAHASNTNDRGIRFRFNGPVRVRGVGIGVTNTSLVNLKVYQGANLLDTIALDLNQKNNAGTYIYFTKPITFQANTDYDVMLTNISGSTTVLLRLDAGTSPPADVSASMLQNMSYLDGTVPGSYTATVGQSQFFLVLDDVLGGTVNLNGNVNINGTMNVN